MAQHYVQVDEKNYCTKNAFALTDSDDPSKWIQVTVATSKEIDFNNQYNHYYVDPTTHTVTKDHDTTTLGDVNTQLASALDTINQQKTAIDTLTQDNQGLQQALGEATKAQVQAQQQFTQTTQTFQAQFGDLTKQFVELGKQVAALQAPAK